MTDWIRRGAAAVAFVCGWAGAAAAQAPLSLTLDEAISRALEQAPRIAEARAREAASSATVKARQAAGRPALTASTGYLRTNHVDEFGIPQPSGAVRVLFPDIPDNYRARAELSLPLYTAGRVASLVESARADERAADADRRRTEADVRLDVTRAYWTLVTARENVRVLEQAQQRTDAYVRDVKSRVDAGILPPNDLLSAQAQRARQQVEVIQGQNNAALAAVDLARLIGVDLDQALTPTSPIDQPLASAAPLAGQPVQALVARAREARSERAGLEDRQAALRLNADAALAATRPQVGALAAVEPSRPNQRFVPRAEEWKTSWDLGVNVSWPLWDGGRARAEHAAALSQAEAVRHQVEEFDAQIGVEIRQRVLELESGRAALAASADAVSAAAEARRVIEERFNAGVATSTDVLDAQVALLSAELERTRLTAALRIGEARLVRAVGAQ